MFKSENELVDTFIKNIKKENKLILREFGIRHGNIDVTIIDNLDLPFNEEQIISLSKPSNAAVYMRLKNDEYMSFKDITDRIGYSSKTIKNSIRELKLLGLIKENEKDFYKRSIPFIMPKTTIKGYEAKLRDFMKVYFQAINNIKYVDYSYIVFPMDKALLIKHKWENKLKQDNIGLIGIDKDINRIIIKATKVNEMSNLNRFLNLTKTASYKKIKGEKYGKFEKNIK